MTALRLIGIKNRFVCLDHFRVAKSDTCAIVGPSGAGKTSLLRIIAGLDPHEGRIVMDEKDIQFLPPHQRQIGFVSQDLHLFPHLSLEGNLYLAMHRSALNGSQKIKQAKRLTKLLRITHLWGRKPDTFSGGEKQRAALARVLASSPRLLLLDEPFSKIDFQTARYLRNEFKNLWKKIGLTTILVTHDLEEAKELAKTIWVMRSGFLTASTASDTPDQKDDRHRNDPFLSTPNILPCRIHEVLENGLVQTKWAGGILFVPDDGGPFSFVSVGHKEIEIGLNPPPGPSINRFAGSITSVDIIDDIAVIIIDVAGIKVHVEISCEKYRRLNLSSGQKIHGLIRLRALRAIQDN